MNKAGNLLTTLLIKGCFKSSENYIKTGLLELDQGSKFSEFDGAESLWVATINKPFWWYRIT